MKRLLAFMVLATRCLAAAAQPSSPAATPARPLPVAQHVVIISADGLRPDCLLLADAPVLHGLLRNGAYTMWARTTAEATTLPAHTSMLTVFG